MSDDKIVVLRREMDGLLRYLERVRIEIASIDRPAEEDLNIQNMGPQLDAIVHATEEATNTIMAAVEKNDELAEKIREKTDDPAITALLDEMTANTGDVFEACSFQDITGQRVTKVAKSIVYVEDRVKSLVDVWGRDELDQVTVEGIEKSEDEQLLSGPQLSGEGLSQDDIDALFD